MVLSHSPSIKNALVILSLTQFAHRLPPYALLLFSIPPFAFHVSRTDLDTLFFGRLMVAYSRGRRALIPGSLVPQSIQRYYDGHEMLGHKRRTTALGRRAWLLDVQVSFALCQLGAWSAGWRKFIRSLPPGVCFALEGYLKRRVRSGVRILTLMIRTLLLDVLSVKISACAVAMRSSPGTHTSSGGGRSIGWKAS
jgi:hypothetical protein